MFTVQVRTKPAYSKSVYKPVYNTRVKNCLHFSITAFENSLKCLFPNKFVLDILRFLYWSLGEDPQDISMIVSQFVLQEKNFPDFVERGILMSLSQILCQLRMDNQNVLSL